MMRLIVIVGMIFLCFSEIMAMKPLKEFVSTPDSMGLDYTDFVVQTSDNATIHCWHLKPSNPNGYTLIVSYGDYGNKSYWLNQAAMFVQFGYTVILYDYRGFGASSEFSIAKEALYYNVFAKDLSAVWQWTQHHLKKQKVVLWSLSMGTIITARALHDEEVKPHKLIMEGLVVNPDAIRTKLQLLAPDDCASMQQTIQEINIPILVFAGSEDQQTTLQDARLFVNQKPKKRQLIEFKNGHLAGFQSLTNKWFGDEYIESVNRFL